MPATVPARDLEQFRTTLDTAAGPASVIDTGGPGPAVVLIHGLGSNSTLWRHVIGRLTGQRRCVAIDLPLHGQTPGTAGQDYSLPGLARFIGACCDALG